MGLYQYVILFSVKDCAPFIKACGFFIDKYAMSFAPYKQGRKDIIFLLIENKDYSDFATITEQLIKK